MANQDGLGQAAQIALNVIPVIPLFLNDDFRREVSEGTPAVSGARIERSSLADLEPSTWRWK